MILRICFIFLLPPWEIVPPPSIMWFSLSSSCGSSPDAPVSLCLNSGHPEKNQLSTCLGWESAEDENDFETWWPARDVCGVLQNDWLIQQTLHDRDIKKLLFSSLLFQLNSFFFFFLWLFCVNLATAERNGLIIYELIVKKKKQLVTILIID